MESVPESGASSTFRTALGLGAVFFVEYLQSPRFYRDVWSSFLNIPVIVTALSGGSDRSVALSAALTMASERVATKLVECTISAGCILSSSRFLHDAVSLHVMFPVVQEYRFGRWWGSRWCRALGRLVVPRFLHSWVNVVLECPLDDGMAFHLMRDSAGVEGPSHNFDALFEPTEADIAAHDEYLRFVSNPPIPSHHSAAESVWEGMPPLCQLALQHYQSLSTSHPTYTIIATSFIPEATIFLMDQLAWSSIYRGRPQRTSRWRVVKPYLAATTSRFVQWSLSLFFRRVGSSIGRAVSSDPTGGGVFWGELIALTLSIPVVVGAADLAQNWVMGKLEQSHPRTVEDEYEDEREEESERTMPRAEEAASIEAAAGRVNYYEVLRVPSNAPAADIKKSYRSLALLHHPDRAGGDPAIEASSKTQMALINDAYDTLINKEKRQVYDAQRSMNDAPDYLKRLEQCSPAQLIALSTLATVSAVTFAGSLGYMELHSSFLRCSLPGRGALRSAG